MKYEVGTHNINKKFDCLKCATDFYNDLKEKKYLKDIYKNIILINNYGWKNDKIQTN